MEYVRSERGKSRKAEAEKVRQLEAELKLRREAVELENEVNAMRETLLRLSFEIDFIRQEREQQKKNSSSWFSFSSWGSNTSKPGNTSHLVSMSRRTLVGTVYNFLLQHTTPCTFFILPPELLVM